MREGAVGRERPRFVRFNPPTVSKLPRSVPKTPRPAQGGQGTLFKSAAQRRHGRYRTSDMSRNAPPFPWFQRQNTLQPSTGDIWKYEAPRRNCALQGAPSNLVCCRCNADWDSTSSAEYTRRTYGDANRSLALASDGAAIRNSLASEGWWPRPGSNRRHTDFQSVALPTELPSHALERPPSLKLRRTFTRPSGLVNGRGAGIRTLDPVIKSHLLYQLSYAPIHQSFRWSEERDSNPRQPPWQGGTLPTELSSHRENGA